MEAHNIQHGTKVMVTDDLVETPIDSIPVNKGDIITIYRYDGKYCGGINTKGERVYIAAWTEVEPINE